MGLVWPLQGTLNTFRTYLPRLVCAITGPLAGYIVPKAVS